MCTNPIPIRNNRRDFNSNYHKAVLYVPCGKCDECRLHQINEMATRLSFESYATYRAGGHILFLTFTHNNEHLPFLEYDGEMQSCFNHDYMKTTLKRLHHYFDKKGLKFKHFVCSEYGKNTKRPHYHGLFFLPAEIDADFFCEYARKSWTENTFYGNIGFMFPSPRDCRIGKKHYVRNHGACAAYASKYACKDMSFYELPIIEAIQLDKEAKFKYRHMMPKNMTSCNVGRCVCDYLEPTTSQLLNPINGKPCTIPRYAIDKLAYRRYYDGRINCKGKKMVSRDLTLWGQQYLDYQFRKAIEHRAQIYATYINHLQCKCDSMQLSIWHYMYQGRTADFWQTVQNLSNFDPFDIDHVCALHYQYDIARCQKSAVHVERVQKLWKQPATKCDFDNAYFRVHPILGCAEPHFWPGDIIQKSRVVTYIHGDNDYNKNDFVFCNDTIFDRELAKLDGYINELQQKAVAKKIEDLKQEKLLRQQKSPH